jgi:hypothetical protein
MVLAQWHTKGNILLERRELVPFVNHPPSRYRGHQERSAAARIGLVQKKNCFARKRRVWH